MSACFVHIKRMRPSPLPEAVGGIGFNYLIYRTRARLPFPDGRCREFVLVLEANINRPVFALLGRQTPGVRFRARDIALTTTCELFTITMRDDNGALLYDAVLPRASFTAHLPAGSCFPSLDQADQFLLGVPFGGEWHPDAGRLRLFAETHDPWEARAGTCQTRCNTFLVGLGVCPEADHVITMTRVPHYFPLFGFDVPVERAGATRAG